MNSYRHRPVESSPTRTQVAQLIPSELGTGQLIKDEFFTLFEAVGALEIMDSKMDSGYLKPDEKFEDDFDFTQTLDSQRILGIMDAMLCSEVAWQKGHPLSQTLFTSLYIDRLLWPEPITLADASFLKGSDSLDADNLVHTVLRAFCLALIKSCDNVHGLITKETYYEEEDFVSNLYNRSLLTRFSSREVQDVIRNAIATIEESSEPQDLRAAILARLRFRLSLLQAVSTDIDGPATEAQEHWNDCSSQLKLIESSHNFAKSVDESFSVKIQRKLDSTVPPRPIVQTSFEEAITFMRGLCENANGAFDALNCTRTSSSITFILVFMSQKPQPCVYVRCLLQALVLRKLRGANREQLRDFCFEDLAELVLPGHLLVDPTHREVELPQDDRFRIAQRMDNFVEQTCEPFLDIIRSLCMNRARTRRMLCNLLGEWDNIQLDLEELDNDMQALTHEKPLWGDSYELPLSSWAYYYKLRQMQWIVQLGFELNIYHLNERAGMYRYLQDIADYRHKHIGRIFGFLEHRLATLTGKERTIEVPLHHSMSFLAVAGEEVEAISLLSASLSSLHEALSLLLLLPPTPARPYGTDELRNVLRLRPFMPLCLPTLNPSDGPFTSVRRLVETIKTPAVYAKFSENQGKALALLDRADRGAREARKAWDTVSKATAETAACIGCEAKWRSGIKEIIRASVIAGITGMKVRKWVLDGAKKGGIKIKLDDGMLDEESRGGLAAPWPVPEVVLE